MGQQLSKRTIQIFESEPIWKALLKFAWPNVLMMLSLGLYTFIDSILSINFAWENYSQYATSSVSAKDYVRLFMSASSPIVLFIMSMTMLFGVGASIRYSINMGAGRYDKALSTIRSGFMVGMVVSFLMIPLLMFTSIPWMGWLYDGVESNQKQIILDIGYDYAKILIWAAPLSMFNQIISGLFRSEGKMKLVTFLTIPSLFINLLLDWVFMAPLGMGVEGAAWATDISYLFVTVGLIVVMVTDKKTQIHFRNLVGFTNLSWIAIVGITLVGIAPFLRNFAQSIASTFETREIGDISTHFTGNALYARNILAGVFPIFGLAFPLIFGFSQGAGPIASYNYGSKNMKRVKETIIWTIIYSFIFGLITYALIAIPNLAGWLLLLSLGVQDQYMSESMSVLLILMAGLPAFAITIGAMTLFSSTDRLMFSTISNSLRGFIFFFPFLYLFKWLSLNSGVTSINFFWWFYPSLVLATSIASVFMMLITFKNLHKKHQTLDQRLEIWSAKFTRDKLDDIIALENAKKTAPISIEVLPKLDTEEYKKINDEMQKIIKSKKISSFFNKKKKNSKPSSNNEEKNSKN